MEMKSNYHRGFRSLLGVLFVLMAWISIISADSTQNFRGSASSNENGDHKVHLQAAYPTAKPTAAPTTASPTRLAANTPPTLLTASPGIQPLYDGETGSYPATGAFGYASSVAGAGQGGSVGLVLAPDPWHSPAFNLPAPVWRSALATKYSSLTMYVSCANANTPIAASFGAYAAGSSAKVYLGAYAVPADPLPSDGIPKIGTVWTLVNIPLSAFVTSTWNLNGVETLYFNSDASSRKCTIDNMYLQYTVSSAPTANPTVAPTLVPTAVPTTAAPTRVAPPTPPTNLVFGNGVQPLFDGETNSYSFATSALSWATVTAGAGISGSNGLLLQPDPWHAPGFVLPSPAYRGSIGSYTYLSLYISCRQTATPVSVHFSRWVADGSGLSPDGNTVFLGSYAVPLDTAPSTATTIGTVWTFVRIPISALQSSSWDLSGAERIYFNSDSSSRQCVLDNVYLEYIPTAAPTAAPTTAKPSAVPSTQPTFFPTRASIPLPPTNLAATPGVQPIYDGEPGSIYGTTFLDFAQNVAGEGIAGSVGLQLQPDYYHSPGFVLPSPAYRNPSFSKWFTFLSFYTKCSSPRTPLQLHLTRWVANKTTTISDGALVSAGAFAVPQDGSGDLTIGLEWIFVRIPVKALTTAGWDLSGAEKIYFNSDGQQRRCVLDNIYLEYNPTFAPTAIPTPAPSTAAPTTAAPTRLPVTVPPVKLVRVLGVVPIYDGEPGSFSSTDIRYAANVPGVGLDGSYGLQLNTDFWHSPAFLLQAPLYRSDITQYNEIVLYARCDVPNTPLTMHFGRWVSSTSGFVGSSLNVYLGEFAEPLDDPPGNVIGTQWTKVRIPITAFVSDGWGLAGAEWIYFNSGPTAPKCYIDNMLARENVGPYIVDVTKMADNVIRVKTNKYFDLTSARQLDNYRLLLRSAESKPTPATQATGEVLTPASVGLQYRFTNFKDNSLVTASNYYIHILFNEKIDCDAAKAQGLEYTLVMSNVTDPAQNPMTSAIWTLDCPSVVTTDSIKINQLGYLPKSPKLAYVGEYYGDMQGAVWAVGSGASIWQYTRVQNVFTQVPLNVLPSAVTGNGGITLRAVAPLSPTDVWIVGDQGTILHFDGNSWSLVSSGTTADLLAIDFAPDRSYAYVVGKQGTILKFTPNPTDSLGSWATVQFPSTAVNPLPDLYCVFTGADEIWVGGVAGTLLRSSYKASTKSFSALAIAKAFTNETILVIEGGRQDGASSILASNGFKFWNRYGAWLLDRNVGFNMRSYVLNPTFSKSGVGVGEGGQASTMTADITPINLFPSGTTANLNAVAMLDENTVFAFGESNACVFGSSVDLSFAWSPCSLPGSTATIYGAASLMEGPLRLPWPRPSAYLQRQSDSDPAEWTTVGTYPVNLRIMNYRLSGEDLYDVDFSTTTSTGTHRLVVEGVGASRVFQISTVAFQSAGYHTCRMLYYQRSGMPNGLEAPYAEPRFARPTDHVFDPSPNGLKIDGAYHWSIATSDLYMNETICPLRNANCDPASFRDGSGGWFDAGDYSKYMSTAAPSVWRLLTTVDVLNARSFPLNDALNIPESSDGVPDLLNEATWELKWMMKMQREDGGAHNKIASEIWEFGAPDSLELGGQYHRFFLYRTTHDSATAGASFALAARLWSTYDPTLSAQFLSRARLAWSFLQAHPDPHPVGGFVNPPGHISGPYPDIDDTDNRAWLAAELYRTTCETQFGDAYVAFLASNNFVVGMGGNDFTDFRLQALWAFYFSKDTCAGRITEPASYVQTRARILSTFKMSVEGSRSRATGNPYRNIGRLDVPEWVGWGSSGGCNWAHFMGILGWHMLDDRSHLDWVVQSMDIVLGANPLATSFITGLGYKYPMDPTQGQSRTDSVDEPLPGYAVMGPFGHVSFASPYFAAAQGNDANYPSLQQLTSPFPVLRRWSDANELPQYNEGGIGPISYLCGLYQVLNADAQQ